MGSLGTDKFNFESLSKYLNEAITTLPDGNLKDALLEHKEENSEKLWRYSRATSTFATTWLFFSLINTLLSIWVITDGFTVDLL